MKKILLDYTREDNEYYLFHIDNDNIWVGTTYVNDTIQIDYSVTFEDVFKKEVKNLSEIYNKIFSSRTEAMEELKKAIKDTGFKIIDKDMAIYS